MVRCCNNKHESMYICSLSAHREHMYMNSCLCVLLLILPHFARLILNRMLTTQESTTPYPSRKISMILSFRSIVKSFEVMMKLYGLNGIIIIEWFYYLKRSSYKKINRSVVKYFIIGCNPIGISFEWYISNTIILDTHQ